MENKFETQKAYYLPVGKGILKDCQWKDWDRDQ